MIEIVIDGKKIAAEQGASLLQVALDNGIEIPHLCTHPCLKPFGACRMCVVEVEGLRKPVSACDTVAAADMVVTTDSDQLREMRRDALKLMLVNHPLDCPVCDKGGECPLQDQAFSHGFCGGQMRTMLFGIGNRFINPFHIATIKYHS